MTDYIDRTMLVAARELLQREFPDASLVEARAELREGVRDDHGPASWSEVCWTVQIMNMHGHGESLEEAVAELRKEAERLAQVPSYAERLAAVLREIPDERFARDTVMRAATELLDGERRAEMRTSR